MLCDGKCHCEHAIAATTNNALSKWQIYINNPPPPAKFSSFSLWPSNSLPPLANAGSATAFPCKSTVTSDVIYILAKECTSSDPLAHCKAIQKTYAIVCTGLTSRHNNWNFFLSSFWPRH